jgi:hypothetical protein
MNTRSRIIRASLAATLLLAGCQGQISTAPVEFQGIQPLHDGLPWTGSGGRTSPDPEDGTLPDTSHRPTTGTVAGT